VVEHSAGQSEVDIAERGRRAAEDHAPDDALSAKVSTIEIFQSCIRESTISGAGSTKSTARTASATLTPGPRSSRPSTNAISGSIRGWIKDSTGIRWCSRWNIPPVRCP
jgi:hypothetical protein